MAYERVHAEATSNARSAREGERELEGERPRCGASITRAH